MQLDTHKWKYLFLRATSDSSEMSLGLEFGNISSSETPRFEKSKQLSDMLKEINLNQEHIKQMECTHQRTVSCSDIESAKGGFLFHRLTKIETQGSRVWIHGGWPSCYCVHVWNFHQIHHNSKQRKFFLKIRFSSLEQYSLWNLCLKKWYYPRENSENHFFPLLSKREWSRMGSTLFFLECKNHFSTLYK